MNKYLMLSAAALVATSTSAVARYRVVHLVAHSATGGSYCDTYTVYWSGVKYADQVDWRSCGISSTSYGMGISRKTKGFKGRDIGKNVTISDNYKGDVEAGYQVSWQFGLPFENGKAFNAYYTTDGVNVIQYITGVYFVASAPAHPSKVSTIDALPRRVRR